MKFIHNLSVDELRTLRMVFRNCEHLRTRQRAHAIILSHKGYPLETIADIFDVTKETICRWFDIWYSRGVQGLFDQPRPGRPKASKIICQ